MVWASLCSVLDRDWTDVLSRDPNINQKPFKDIFKMMQTSFLERNPLITRKLAALKILKPKEEQMSICLYRLVEDYKSAQLDLALLETRSLLHLTILFASDALSEKIKDIFVEQMWVTPNISSLDDIFA